MSNAIKIHYSHPSQVVALSAYVVLLEMGKMKVKLLQDGKVSVTWKPEQAQWFIDCFRHDWEKMVNERPYLFAVAMETFIQLDRTYNITGDTQNAA